MYFVLGTGWYAELLKVLLMSLEYILTETSFPYILYKVDLIHLQLVWTEHIATKNFRLTTIII